METLLQALFWCPRCWRVVGYWLFSACAALALLGWRLMSRVGRAEDRVGINIDLTKIIDSLPIPAPSNAAEMALTVAGAATGFLLARLGRWAERF